MIYPMFCFLFLALVATILYSRIHKVSGRVLSRPPGPPPRRIIGNLLDIPRDREALAYSSMADKYGDFVYLSVFSKNIFVISSAHILDELFNKRSTNYSGRPYSTMLNELMDLEWIFAFRSYGKEWREQRKMFHSHFQDSAIHDYKPIQAKAALDVARDIIASPQNLKHHLHMHVAKVLFSITYAMEITPENDHLVHLSDEVIMAWSKAAVPGAYLVDAIPLLRCIPEWAIPGGGFHKDARECKEKAIFARDSPFETVVQQMKNGTAAPSLVSKLLADSNLGPDTIKNIQSTSGTVYFAGIEALSIVLQTFILAMATHPDVLLRAQKEIDSIVGPEHIPTFDDIKDLPLVNAIVKEVLRWNPPAPLAIPHVTVATDEYNGYTIPAGSIVIGNLWKILHNPDVYPDPMCFDPDRFILSGLKDKNSVSAALRDYESVYGLGRRVCPGRFIAIQQLSITIAVILSLFDIGCGVDEKGVPVHVKPEFTFGLASHPLPFKYSITPRGEYVQHLLSSEN